MNQFWIACAVLLVVALPFVVLPLWRGGSVQEKKIRRDDANLEILRDQSAELDADFRDGLLEQDAYEQGKRELQERLLEEVKTTGQSVIQKRRPAMILALLLGVLLPVFSVLLYAMIGNIKALDPQERNAPAASGFGVLRSEAALQELEKKLEQHPEDQEGWWMLAQSYNELQRFPDAVRAFQHLIKLVPDEAQIWASYADAYAMTNNRSLLGEPEKFLDRALKLDGNNVLALALSGSAAMERGDYAAAITHWTKLVSLLPPDNPMLKDINQGIEQARQFLSMQKGGKEKPAGFPTVSGKASSQATISGRITMDPALAVKAAPDDTVFIIVRDAQGQKPLLAVLRKQVRDLPLQFELDDSNAIQPQAKLSESGQVVVVARISRSGNPIAQPGDLQGSTAAVKPGARDLKIVIDTVVPSL